MYDCWRDSPSDRPNAQDIIRKLIDPAFYLLRNYITEIDKEGMHKIDYMMDVPHYKSQIPYNLNRNLCVWGVETERKRCSLMNVENRKKIESRLPTEQPVGAACVVEEEGYPARIWISTRGQRPTRESGYREIEIYGQLTRTGSYCCLWRYITKDTVLCLVADYINGKPLVYASLLSGHFHAYARKADFQHGFVSMKHHEYTLTSERNNEECSQWNIVYKLQIGNPPVHSILVVNDEIWCACGGDIHLLHRENREYFHKISVFQNKDTLLTQMVQHDGRVYVTTFKGDEAVVIVIDVEMRNVIGNLCCSELNPRKNMVFVRTERTFAMKFVTQVSTVDEGDEEMTGALQVTELHPQGNASSQAQFIMPPESLSLRYYPKQKIQVCNNQLYPCRNDKIRNRRSTGFNQNNIQEPDRKEVRVRSIMARDGLLWVTRAMGDILLINIDTNREGYGEVVACLRMPHDDKTLYTAKSVSLLCHTQEKYIANYQQLFGRNKDAQKEHITIWQAVGLKQLEEIVAQIDMLLTCTYKPH
ncbi:Leucine-rich repeat serine/threonine-protein kinase 1-like [Oopsacas minuta]|uniref:Leucine-rich repeat serine/threonine-protein kinase 1-like n=1 Tax=Oopsacas minuta TaxID=111878 RepID=A0AAV7KHN2_9METZ|nr:Leucine-rich repeat serine/threonine-protein kinase 1-like [Oopsacas minuta]